MLLGITRQAIYQRESRAKLRTIELAPVKAMVLEIRRFMPRLGGRKLYFLLKPKRSYTKTTFGKHWMKKHPNLLKNMQPSRPEEVFVSDITYVQSAQGVHYRSLVTDAYSCKIMGYELSDEMKATDVVKALDMTINNRQYHVVRFVIQIEDCSIARGYIK